MTAISTTPFGTTRTGRQVALYTLRNGPLEAGVLTYGGTLAFLRTPDKNGVSTDVVLGYDTIEGYEKGDKYLGALVGRCANRIENGEFTLNGRTFRLAKNDGGVHHLHGGDVGFDKKIWAAREENGALVLTYESPDGEEGYPGTLSVTVTYSLSEDGTLTLDYQAVSDKDTICNLTNHSYFNLSGQDSGDILSQKIRIFGSCYTPADAKSIPHGAISSVEGTPMDLRAPTPIGAHINDDFTQLQWAGGYDHNWIIDGCPGDLRKMACAFDEGSGITLTAYTTLPGMQFYAGNYLDGVVPGKGKGTNGYRCGFCLESQYYPNSINCSQYPQPVLRAGERYHQVTAYRLGLLGE